GRPDLTAERFVPSPFAQRPGERLYRSGDRVRRRADGALEYLGRVDRQIKLRGLRIELEEIEAVLAQHEAVREAAVVTDGDDVAARLVAYVVAAQRGPAAPRPDGPELRGFLKTQLPEHMVPAVYVFLEALPLAPNGKVDRRALPAPDGTRPDVRAPYTAPRTGTETAVADIWCELMRIDRAGVDDDFFELGGHSLLATQLIWRIRERCGVDLPLRTVFEKPTLGELAAALDGAAAAADAPDQLRLERGGDDLDLLLGELGALPDDEVERLLGEAR
ncbi:MAG: AMP-binding protein, partial [Gammaproteobacteria bacterium]|nr:AMP-binding protein [Gammaproteobacteria bacterium]